MIDFPLGLDGLNFLIEHRTAFMSSLLHFFTWLGEDEGYILIITGIYLMHDKKYAIRLAFLVLVTMSVNHLLKMVIGNPRPFVTEGSFMKKWLVDPEYARELASEFSTPSGHAMSSFVFYGYLYSTFKNTYFRILAILVIVLIGVSRPYLGVHFVEDVMLGWGVAFLAILLVLKYSGEIGKVWNSQGPLKQLLITLSASLTLWLVTFYLHGGDIKSQPLPFVGHMGFIMGLVLGSNLEAKYVNFDPKSGSIVLKLTRWLLAVVLVMIPLLLMDNASWINWTSPTFSTHIVQYLGYVTAGLLGIFLAPLLVLKLKLVDRVS